MKEFIGKDQQFVTDWFACQGLDKIVEVVTAVLNNSRPSRVFFPMAKCVFGGRQSSVIEERLHSTRLIQRFPVR